MASKTTKRVTAVRVRGHKRTIALGLLVVVLVFIAHDRFPHAFEFIELKVLDLRMYSGQIAPPTGEVAIAAIDDKSIAELGQWVWPRKIMAELIQALNDYKVIIVASDVLFSERDENDITRAEIAANLTSDKLPSQEISQAVGSSGDDAFAAALKSQGNTILSYYFESIYSGDIPQTDTTHVKGAITKVRPPGPLIFNIVNQRPHSVTPYVAHEYVPPIDKLSNAASTIAFVNVDHDLDGGIRSEYTAIRFDDLFCAPLFLAVAHAATGGQPLKLTIDERGIEQVRIADVDIPVDLAGHMMLKYRGPKGTFPHYSVSDIINHKVAPAALAGKIVIFGMTATGLGDRGVTPVDDEMPRVEIHATAIDDVLKGDFVFKPRGATLEYSAAALLGLAIAIAAGTVSAISSLVAALVLGIGYFVFAQHRLNATGEMIGVVFPLSTLSLTYLALVSYRYFTEGREKAYLRHAFEHYLHPDIISSLVDQPQGLKLGGERRVLTILFADIVNYTGLSEKTDPAALVALLNDYMTKMTDRILESGGVVDKIRGDGIMAFWGAPIEVPNHAGAAINSALAMLTELNSLRKNDPRFKDIDIGIGIATGEAIVGNFGGANRFDYSVIGDTVNLASRLEGLTRQFKVHLLVSKQTVVDSHGRYIARELGLVKVKGKEQHVPVVEVAGHKDDGVDPAFYNRFATVIDLIHQGSAANARAELQAMHTERPNDEVVRLYLEKLGADPETAPSEMVFEFDTK
jgi:adenylate cyclase